MEKKLVNSDKEVIEYLLSEAGDDFYVVEDILNVEFPFEDGKFHSDLWRDEGLDESQPVVYTSWRKKSEDSGFPESYPCVIVSSFESDLDRYGKFSIQIVEYVYLSDFDVNPDLVDC